MNIRVLTLRNIGNSRLTIGVGSPLIDDATDITGTDITDGYTTLYEGEGIIVLLPGKIFRIEEDRVNLGQIENLVNLKQLKVENELRSVSDLTVEG